MSGDDCQQADDIRTLIAGLGDLRDVIQDAEPSVKAAIYEQLGLKVTYLLGQEKLRADVTISPESLGPEKRQIWGNGSCPRRKSNQLHMLAVWP